MNSSPHPVDVHVGKRVRQAREAAGYNQSDLGRALGLTFQQVQKYERGSNRVSASKLADISRFLDLPIDWFFAGLGLPGDAGARADGAALDLIRPDERELLKAYGDMTTAGKRSLRTIARAAADGASHGEAEA